MLCFARRICAIIINRIFALIHWPEHDPESSIGTPELATSLEFRRLPGGFFKIILILFFFSGSQF